MVFLFSVERLVLVLMLWELWIVMVKRDERDTSLMMYQKL